MLMNCLVPWYYERTTVAWPAKPNSSFYLELSHPDLHVLCKTPA